MAQDSYLTIIIPIFQEISMTNCIISDIVFYNRFMCPVDCDKAAKRIVNTQTDSEMTK